MSSPCYVRLARFLVAVAVPLLLWHAWHGEEGWIPSYHALHTLLEVISVSTSLMVAVAALVPGEHTRPLLPCLGAGFLTVAVLDLFHLLSFPGLPDFFTVNTVHKSIVFWLGARYAVAFALGCALAPRYRLLAPGFFLFWLGAVSLAGWAPEGTLPPLYDSGGLTPLKIGLEWGVGLLYLGLARFLWRQTEELPVDGRCLAMGLLVLATGELFFTQYVRVSGIANLLGHCYKIAGEAFLFYAIVVARFIAPYRELAIEKCRHEETARRYRALFEEAPEGVLVVAADAGTIVAANPAAETLFQAGSGGLVGLAVEELIPAETQIAHVGYRQSYQENPRRRPMGTGLDLEGLRRDGSRFYADIALAPLDLEGRAHTLVFVRDVSQQVEDRRRLTQLVYFDDLTGLPNRRGLRAALAERVAMGDVWIVLCFDLDGLARINHVFGHAKGDQVLVRVAERLGKALRPGEYLARFQGDEFVVLLPRNTALEARVRDLLGALGRPVELPPDLRLRVAATGGYARYPEDASDPETLLRYAELAMFSAKRRQRRGVEGFDASVPVRTARWLALASRLSEALAAGEFFLVFQPRVQLATGRVAGFEVLLRWRGKDGTVNPAEFIPVAEETGFILELGQWVLEEACRVFHSWIEAGLEPGRLAVNLSLRQLADPEFLGRLEHVLAATGLPPHRLELEVTESAAMEEAEWILPHLHALHRAGITLALDDFGTGYSSLAHLQSLPVSVLKIDLTFIRRLGTRDGEAIVRTILALAKSLGLFTVAEGVETDAQCRWLETQGCTEMQGYLESPPLEAEAARQYLERRRLSPTPAARPG
ncbi:MAG TPA: EAL domain-containing protein [Methylococcus sp.]|nr:EAL domain-containing protein [Methylococcus sp.]